MMGEKSLLCQQFNDWQLVSAQGGTPKSITDSFDENPGLIEWKADGIYFAGSEKTASHLFRVDPARRKITRISQPDNLIAGSFSFTRTGDRHGVHRRFAHQH